MILEIKVEQDMTLACQPWRITAQLSLPDKVVKEAIVLVDLATEVPYALRILADELGREIASPALRTGFYEIKQLEKE